MGSKQEDRIRRMPQIETRVDKSKDGRFIIHRTIITDIKPVNYYNAIIDGKAVNTEE